MTYRGHAVLRTLIRCHFSPAETTGSAYIYSGSKDGRIHARLFPVFLPQVSKPLTLCSLSDVDMVSGRASRPDLRSIAHFGNALRSLWT
jgi:hypothetical protein